MKKKVDLDRYSFLRAFDKHITQTNTSLDCGMWWILCGLKANQTYMYLVYVHWNEILSFSFLCDICNEVHEHMPWLSELWWDHTIMIIIL